MKIKYYYTCSKCRIIKTDDDLESEGYPPPSEDYPPLCPTCWDIFQQHKTK